MKRIFIISIFLFSCSDFGIENQITSNPKIYFSRYSDPNREYKNIRMIFHNKMFSWRKALKTDSVVVDSITLSDDEWRNIANRYSINELKKIETSAECGPNKESFAIFDGGDAVSFYFEVNSTEQQIKHHVNGMSSEVIGLIKELRSIEVKYHSSTRQ